MGHAYDPGIGMPAAKQNQSLWPKSGEMSYLVDSMELRLELNLARSDARGAVGGGPHPFVTSRHDESLVGEYVCLHPNLWGFAFGSVFPC